MKKIKNFNLVRTGDWILIRNPNYSKKDKSQTIIVVKSRVILIYAFNILGKMIKFEIKRNRLKNTLEFYQPDWETLFSNL